MCKHHFETYLCISSTMWPIDRCMKVLTRLGGDTPREGRGACTLLWSVTVTPAVAALIPTRGRRPSDITRLHLIIKTPTHTRIRWRIIIILFVSSLFIRIISILEKTAMVNAHPCFWLKATYLTSKRYKQSWKYSPELSRLEILTENWAQVPGTQLWPHGTLQKWAKLFSCLAMISAVQYFTQMIPLAALINSLVCLALANV